MTKSQAKDKIAEIIKLRVLAASYLISGNTPKYEHHHNLADKSTEELINQFPKVYV